MKFLIVKASSLGDIIHVFPVVQYLRKRFPDSQIDWVVEKSFAELLESHPDINQVYCVQTKKWRKAPFNRAHWQEIGDFRKNLQGTQYDVAFDFQGNVKSGLLLSQAKSIDKVGFGFKSVPEWPNTLFTNRRFNPKAHQNIREDYLSLVKDYFGDEESSFADEGVVLQISSEQDKLIHDLLKKPELQQEVKVVVCPGSAWNNKQVTKDALESFLKLLQKDLSCSFIFVWGTKEEELLAEALQRQFPSSSLKLDRQPLPVLQNLMGRCQLVVAMDSLPLHLAGTTATPTFSVFGASSSAKYQPKGESHLSLQGQCPYGKTFEKRCPILRTCKTGFCIRSLTGNQLYDAWRRKRR